KRFNADNHRWFACAIKPLGGFPHCFFDLSCVRMGKLQFAIPFHNVAWDLNFTVNHVLMNFDVPRLMMEPGLPDDFINVRCRSPRISNDLCRARDFLENVILRLDLLSLMMNEDAEFPFFFAW